MATSLASLARAGVGKARMTAASNALEFTTNTPHGTIDPARVHARTAPRRSVSAIIRRLAVVLHKDDREPRLATNYMQMVDCETVKFVVSERCTAPRLSHASTAIVC